MSLKKKFKYVYAVSGYVIAVALIISIMLSIRGMVVFTDTLDENDKAMNLYNAVANERKLLRAYLQDEQPHTSEHLEEAGRNTRDMLMQLPMDYKSMTEEQYIILQSIHNAYDSYKQIYEQLGSMDTESEEYKQLIDKCYTVQEYLEEYAKNYEKLTVSLGSEEYNTQKRLFYVIPTICIIIAGVVIILFMWIKHFISCKIVRPVLELSNEARRISMNDFSGNDIKAEGNDEISMLIKSFVEMKHSTKKYISTIEEKHKIENQLEQMRFEMLKNQINPHFLFNTLNLIAGTAQIEDAEVTEKMIVTLSRLFRYNLKTQTTFMPLEQEIKIVGDYMYLQQMRFGQRIKYICDADEKCMYELVPSFVLQPLVENAIIHGLSHSSQGGLIYIRCFIKEDRMWLSVADTGLGMDKDRLMAVRSCIEDIQKADETIQRKTVGVGVGNIAHRIKAMYNDSGMKIYSTKGRGTVVQVYFKYRDNEDTGQK